MERPTRGSEEAKRSDALVPGMQDFTEGVVPRSSGCRGAHPCRAGSVWQLASAGGCAGDRVPCPTVREVGQSPLGRKTAGPGLLRVLLKKMLPIGCGMLWVISVSVSFHSCVSHQR